MGMVAGWGGGALWAGWPAGVARAQTPESTLALSPTLAVSDAQSGMMLTEENLGRLERVLRSLRLPDRASQALPPPTPAATQQQSGSGPQPNAPIKLVAGQATFRITHDGEGLFTLFLLNAQGQRVAYLGQALGALDRVYSLAVPLSADYALVVTADGAWTVTVEQ